MCSSNGTHRVRRWLIIEKNAAPTVDLQVDEAGCKYRTGRHSFAGPVTRTMMMRRDALNHSTIDQDDRIIVPSISIENAVSRNCRLSSLGVFGWFLNHGSLPHWPVGQARFTLAELQDARLGDRYAIIRTELRQRATVPETCAHNVCALSIAVLRV